MLKFIGAALVVIAIILIIAFWSQISNFFGWSSEGDTCTTATGNLGTIQDGVCQDTVLPPPPVDVNVQERIILPNYQLRRAGSTYYYGY